MPHDKNHNEIEFGDGARFVDQYGKHRVGVVASANDDLVEFSVPMIGGCYRCVVSPESCEVLTRADGTLVAWVNATTEGGEHTTMPYQEIDPTQEAQAEAPPAEAPTPEPDPSAPLDATTEL